MRAGGFAEPRVIRLINRRFVPFFFNTNGLGEGDDNDATTFVEGKLETSYAHLSGFSPDPGGSHVGTSALYASKDELFEFLLELLAAHPELAEDTPEESALFEAAALQQAGPATLLEAAAVNEELGRYEAARGLVERTLSSRNATPEEWARGFRLLVAMARDEGRWGSVAELCVRAQKRKAWLPLDVGARPGDGARLPRPGRRPALSGTADSRAGDRSSSPHPENGRAVLRGRGLLLHR